MLPGPEHGEELRDAHAHVAVHSVRLHVLEIPVAQVREVRLGSPTYFLIFKRHFSKICKIENTRKSLLTDVERVVLGCIEADFCNQIAFVKLYKICALESQKRTE